MINTTKWTHFGYADMMSYYKWMIDRGLNEKLTIFWLIKCEATERLIYWLMIELTHCLIAWLIDRLVDYFSDWLKT